MFLVAVVFAAVAGSGDATVCKGTICKPSDSVSRPSRHLGGDRVGNAVICPSAYVVDGDTIHCGHPRIRLLGVDAPEIEPCPRYRVCAPGDGQASKRSLIDALKFGPVSYQPITVDRFGRTVAVVWAGRVNLSCWQLQQNQAIYKPRWDNGGIIGRDCR